MSRVDDQKVVDDKLAVASDLCKFAAENQPSSKALLKDSADVGDISTAARAGTGTGSASQIGRRSAMVIMFFVSLCSNSQPVVLLL